MRETIARRHVTFPLSSCSEISADLDDELPMIVCLQSQVGWDPYSRGALCGLVTDHVVSCWFHDPPGL